MEKAMDKFIVYYYGFCLLVSGIIIGGTIGLTIDGFLAGQHIVVFYIISLSIIFIVAIFRKWYIKFKEQEIKNVR
jgi:hypothetical protein